MQMIVAEAMVEAVRPRLAAFDLPIDIVSVDRDGHASGDVRQATVFFRAFMSQAGYERVLASAPQVRWVHTNSAGVDGLVRPELAQRGVILTNGAGVYAIPIAEWVLYALLMIVKRGPQMIQAQEARRWATQGDFDELLGKTLTILGVGGIGGEIARRAAAFGMRVWGANRSGRPVAQVERIVGGDEWRTLLPATDFLVIATPLTAATHHLLGAPELALLPPHAWLINIARGAIVDEPALIAALHAGTLAGAALDTFENEPLPPDNPLWTMPNVIVSPHRSGSSPRSQARNVDLFIDNLQRYIAGVELRNIVDQTAGY